MAARDFDYSELGDPIGALLDAISGGGGAGAGGGSDYGYNSGKETPGRGNPYDYAGAYGGGGMGGPSFAAASAAGNMPDSGTSGHNPPDFFFGGGNNANSDMGSGPTGMGGIAALNAAATPLGKSNDFARAMGWLDNNLGSGQPYFGQSFQDSPYRGGYDPSTGPSAGAPGMTPNTPFNRDQYYTEPGGNPTVSSPSAASGPQHNYAGPSVPLSGPGGPVSPFQSENDAFNALNAANAALGVQAPAAARPVPAAPPTPAGAAPLGLPNIDGLATGGGLRSAPIRGTAIGATRDLAAPPLPPIPDNSPLANPAGSNANYARAALTDPRLREPSNPLTGFPIGSAQNPITGFQSAGLNRQVPPGVRGSSIGPMIMAEEPFFNGAMDPADDGMGLGGFSGLVNGMRQPPPNNRGAQRRRRF